MKKIFIIYFSWIFITVLFSCGKAKLTSGFEILDASKTHIAFENKLEPREGFGILYYLYYYNGGGVAIGDINNDGLADIYFTANSKGNNKLYLNKGNFDFEDITDQAGVRGNSDWCTGVTMADVNGDGLLDIYVSAFAKKFGLNGHNELFINKGNNTFVESAAEYGLDFSGYTVQSGFFDYDHDGDLDCFILNESLQPNGNIVNADKRNLFDAHAGDYLLRNDMKTKGMFTDVSKEAGIYQSSLGYGLGLGIADLNNDGWDDIYVGNDFHENDYYYVNLGNGKFKEAGADHFRHYSRFSMGNDVADYNNDTQIDVITVDMLPPDEKTLKTYGSEERSDIYNFKIINNGFQHQVSRNCLQRNNGNGTSFSEVGLAANVASTDWSWSPLFADFNNDGWKDLFITNGIVKRPVDLDYVRFVSDLQRKIKRDASTEYDAQTLDKMPEGSSHPFAFQNNKKGQFEDVSSSWGIADMKGFYNGAAYGDLDNDGDVDLVINALNSSALILKNNLPRKNYIAIELKGKELNTKGIGAKAYIFYNSNVQLLQMMPTRGFQSSVEYRLHFGIDTCQTIDSLLIVWPNQKYQVLKKCEINKVITANEHEAYRDFQYHKFFPGTKEFFSNVNIETNPEWKHIENNYEDFNVQYLIPHKESTRGPKVTVGDVNKDGLDDFYVCGAKGSSGALMIQLANGTFIKSDSILFNRYKDSEEVDAHFFDANGDGYIDLWVVAGGNQMPSSPIANADRLFLNDTKGHFQLATNAIPQIYYTKSCITVADIDQDGDQDVFVGVLLDQQRFGTPQNSYLYLNNGKGKFTHAEMSRINLTQIGMVTTAVFEDLNQDGWPDLVVAGEFMPVTIYWNRKGNFEKKLLPASSGLWQSLYITDLNKDGRLDILGGNWGLNSKLASGKNGPIKLYTADFDGNGAIESILCYTIDGVEYPFLPKDLLEIQLPVLKKAYLTYSEVAGKSVQYMFYDLFKGYSELQAEVLASSFYINEENEKFKRSDLPFDAQLAPIFSFNEFKQGEQKFILAGGNFFDVIPYEGRYDAQPLVLLNCENNQIKYVHQANLLSINGQVRDLKWVKGTQQRNLVVARNNDGLVFLQPKALIPSK
ncbi:MAG: VCBS repeat-containing protein [Bacteroidetes bacterium]|nr:VCBS repeat-containing protein [Bacteroidota bacterium]MBS1539157.1 VCBS repeat-containing protein [Bacteroidota bacterium]